MSVLQCGVSLGFSGTNSSQLAGLLTNRVPAPSVAPHKRGMARLQLEFKSHHMGIR